MFFIKRTPKSKNTLRQEDYTVYSFILCAIIDENTAIDVKLICSNKKGDGKKLLHHLDTYLNMEMKQVNEIVLEALNETKLIRWYTENGFRKYKFVNKFCDDDKAVVLMKKTVTRDS